MPGRGSKHWQEQQAVAQVEAEALLVMNFPSDLQKQILTRSTFSLLLLGSKVLVFLKSTITGGEVWIMYTAPLIEPQY